MDSIKKYALYFLILVYVSGSIGFVLKPSFFAPFTPYTLFFTCAVYLLHQPYSDYKFVLAFLVVAVLGYFFEVVGVKTGLVFGNYQYGKALGFSYLNVPLIISLNWALFISAGVCLAKKYFNDKSIVLILTAIIATSIDFLIEHVAPKLDFWRFRGGMPSFHNYIGWFFISFLCAFLFYKPLTKGKFNPALIILALQIEFFGIIYLFNK
jgi:bisanhydrobacterioruberin hydratase